MACFMGAVDPNVSNVSVITFRKTFTKDKMIEMERKTNLQKRRQLEKSRRDTRVRKIKKYQPLCISRKFLEYAYRMKWNDETADAAALIMHYCFMRRKKISDSGWIPIPYQAFKGLFGKDYRRIVQLLLDVGFLEYDEVRGSKKGRHCRYYRVCQELRNDEISASYRLQSKALQERFIENKKEWACKSDAKRLERARAKVEAAFSISDNPDSQNVNKSFYYLVEQGHLTEMQFATIKRLAMNAHLLKIDIDDADMLVVAKRHYDNKKQSGKINCEFDAYTQWLQGTIERTSRQKIKIDEYGRFHVPMTNLMRMLWDFVSYKKQELAAVDVKSSHVFCLLALIKDIEINYFGGCGLHKERLAKCQFSRQIQMIPGLVEHLRQVSGIYQAMNYFEFKQSIPDDLSERKKMMYSMFLRFTKRFIKDVHKVKQFYLHEKFKEVNPIKLKNFLGKYYFKSSDFVTVTDKFDDTGKNRNSDVVDLSKISDLLETYKLKSDLEIHYVSGISSISNNIQSVSHDDHVNMSNTPITLPVHDPDMAVGDGIHDILCQRVMENLRSCKFVLKKENDLNKSTAGISSFRSLFFPSSDEILEFEAMLRDDFYVLLMHAIGLKITDESRDEFKGAFFTFLYRPAFSRFNGRRNVLREDGTWGYEGIVDPVRQAMESRLPSIVLFLDICKCKPGTLDRKGEDYKKISHAIQSIESQILCECCANLWKKYPKMFLTTLHDCIKCLPKDVDNVKAELVQTFETYHIAPKFAVKEHKRPSDLTN